MQRSGMRGIKKKMKIFINNKFETLKNFILNISERFDIEGHTIHKIRNEVKVFRVGDIEVNVKKFAIPHFFNRIVYTFFRKSKAERAYHNALKLLSCGIDTPSPVGYLHIKRHGLFYDSYFISLQSPYNRNLTEIIEKTEKENIEVALGKFIALLHEKEVLHLDLSTGNILFEEIDNEVHFSVVDLNRMKFCRIDKNLGCKNFNRLRVSEKVMRIIAKSYACAQNFDENECEKLILQNNANYLKKYNLKKRLKNLSLRA